MDFTDLASPSFYSFGKLIPQLYTRIPVFLFLVHCEELEERKEDKKQVRKEKEKEEADKA